VGVPSEVVTRVASVQQEPLRSTSCYLTFTNVISAVATAAAAAAAAMKETYLPACCTERLGCA
jgi:nicotinate-nucleotide pyrophosphorylase